MNAIKESGFCDLRSKVKHPDKRELTRDCADVFAHPIIMIIVFILGFLVFAWGIWSAASYLSGFDKNLRLLWWQTSVAFVFITIIAFAIPYRFRFGFNLYGLIFWLLLVEYAIFVICFPITWFTADHLESIEYIKSLSIQHPPPKPVVVDI